MDSSFGDRLKASRKRSGLVQAQLADAVGVGQAAIANYEKGSRFPGEATLRRITTVLDVSLDYLMGVSEGGEGEGNAESVEGYLHEDAAFPVASLMDLLRSRSVRHAYRFIQGRFNRTPGISAEICIRALIPVLRLAGSLWEQGELSVAEEHMISAKVRELVVLFCNADTDDPVPGSGERKTWLGFAAPGDEHDIPMLMLSHLMRQRGWDALFLGLCPPLSSLLAALERYKPDVIAVSITMSSSWNGLVAYLREIHRSPACPSRVIVGGNGVETHRAEAKSLGVEIVDSLIDAVDAAERDERR